MRRFIEKLTPARVAVAAVVCVAAVGGAAYAVLHAGSSSSEASHAAVSSLHPGSAAATVAVEQGLKATRHAAQRKVEKAQAKVRLHAKVQKAVEKKRSRPRPVAANDSSTLNKAPRVAKPSVSTSVPSVRKARRTDRARSAGEKCRHAVAAPKRSDQPTARRTCKSRSTQPPPPPPPPPVSQPGDDH